MPSRLFFCDYFQVSDDDLDAYGAFNISVVSDLPLFIDPFLLFQSEKPEYQALHDEIIRYLLFLRDNAERAHQNGGLLKEWYFFKEVKQNWLGYTFLGNSGHGLGVKFATALRESLAELFEGGKDAIHLEQVTLLDKGVGKDSVSDFTTNLIKKYLLEYTQNFAVQFIAPEFRRNCAVERVEFDYKLKVWKSRTYDLPYFRNQYVLLTPLDILARDDTWINREDLLGQIDRVIASCDDETLRARINQYFASKVMENLRKPDPRYEAILDTLRRFPELYEQYMKIKEKEGDVAEAKSRESVNETYLIFVAQVRSLIQELEEHTEFFEHVPDSYEEALRRVLAFKHYVEHQDGYKVINRAGKPFSNETEVQLFFGLVWYGTTLDVNREPNNGRGPVDFKVSYGRGNAALVELKLASNTALRRNLQRQVEIYAEANQTEKAIKVILYYTAEDEARARKIIKELGLDKDENVVLIDARNDNKPSASKA